MNIGGDGTLHLHRVILLGARTEIAQVVGGEIDAANEGEAAVDGDQLAVQAPEHVGAHAQQSRTRVEHMQADTGLGERIDEFLRQVGRAVAVDRDRHDLV